MEILGVFIELPIVIIGAIIALVLITLIVLAVKSDKKNAKEVPDLDTREEYGDFHGLLTKEDFEIRADDHMLEVYRQQWIMAEPGDQKDNYLLLYLALKQLNKEQDETDYEWTQQQCEDRMDEIIKELSEKTGLKLIENELDDSEYEAYFNSDEADASDETDEADEADADVVDDTADDNNESEVNK